MTVQVSDLQAVNASLKHVGADLKAFADQTKSGLSEVRARMLELEQTVAAGGTSGRFQGAARSSVGAAVLAEINGGHSAFQHLAAGNIGSATFRISSPIHAITNEPGSPSSDGAYMPSQPEQGVQGQVLRPLSLLAVLPRRGTERDSVEFVQLSSTGDADEQGDEGTPKAASSFDGTLMRAEIATIALWTPASKQVLADHRALQGEIDRVLVHKCAKRLERLVVNGGTGGGAGSRISGLLDNCTAFTPTVGGTSADVLGEAIAVMRSNGYMPDLIVMNPLDWHAISIDKTEQTEDYRLGKPTQPAPPSLWGVPVVTSASLDQGEALVIDRNFVTVLDRESPSVQISNSHEDFFTRNLVAILGELRAGLEVRDTAAVYQVTLEPSS